jgi:alkaline phosphatase D
MSRTFSTIISLSILISMILACSNPSQKEGPFFGNGFRNGWADQHSIVIWTRLTKTAELNRNGPPFKLPQTEANKLGKLTDREQIMKEQLPDGYALEQMEGACPGANGQVKLLWFPHNAPAEKVESDWMRVNPEMDFTHQWRLEKLKSGTEYVVKLYARASETAAISDSIDGFFQTPPDPGVVGNLRFCIVTCHDYPRRDDPANGHKIYTAMLKQMPHFYVHTGDVEYYDKPYPYALTEELMRFKWNRFFALPYQRLFFTEVTTYFMKDDHDVLRDDAYPGMSYGQVSFGRGLDIFDKEQFPSSDQLYKTVRWGKNLQIWIMEGRNFRSPNNMPDGPGKSIWGAEQKAWLFSTLKESDATFKLVIVSTPILGPDRKNKKDNYSNEVFKTEGDEIRQALNQYNNLVIVNGDRHWQYVTHPKETNLWEFGCGPGSDSHAEGWPPKEVRPEHRFLRVKGGYLYGTTKSGENGNTQLTLQHCDVDGNVVHEEVFNEKYN